MAHPELLRSVSARALASTPPARRARPRTRSPAGCVCGLASCAWRPRTMAGAAASPEASKHRADALERENAALKRALRERPSVSTEAAAASLEAQASPGAAPRGPPPSIGDFSHKLTLSSKKSSSVSLCREVGGDEAARRPRGAGRVGVGPRPSTRDARRRRRRVAGRGQELRAGPLPPGRGRRRARRDVARAAPALRVVGKNGERRR